MECKVPYVSKSFLRADDSTLHLSTESGHVRPSIRAGEWSGFDVRLSSYHLEALASGKIKQLVLNERKAVLVVEKQAPEQPREHPHGQEESRLAADPARAIGRQPPAGHHDVHVGVMQQVLPPSVQDGEEADLGAQVLGIGGDGAQRLGTGVEQDVVEHLLVLVGERCDRLGHGEDDVEIFDLEQLRLPVLQPLGARERLALRAMPISATVESDALMAAGIAAFDMATERCGAAALDGAHDAALPTAERVGLPVRRSMLAEDLRHFQSKWRGWGHGRRSEMRGRRRWRFERLGLG